MLSQRTTAEGIGVRPLKDSLDAPFLAVDEGNQANSVRTASWHDGPGRIERSGLVCVDGKAADVAPLRMKYDVVFQTVTITIVHESFPRAIHAPQLPHR